MLVWTQWAIKDDVPYKTKESLVRDFRKIKSKTGWLIYVGREVDEDLVMPMPEKDLGSVMEYIFSGNMLSDDVSLSTDDNNDLVFWCNLNCGDPEIEFYIVIKELKPDLDFIELCFTCENFMNNNAIGFDLDDWSTPIGQRIYELKKKEVK